MSGCAVVDIEALLLKRIEITECQKGSQAVEPIWHSERYEVEWNRIPLIHGDKKAYNSIATTF